MSLSWRRHADRWGNRTAIVDGDERVSYVELEERVATAAGRLATLGIGTGDRVALLSRNRLDVLVSALAAWRLGGAFAPVSHRLTPATISRPMERIDPDLVLFESAQRDLVRQFDARSFEEFERVTPSEYTPAEPDEERPSLLFHTEEGKRVVTLSERAVEWSCIASVTGWGLGRHDRTLTLRPLSLPDCLLGFVLPLLTVGGRVVLQRAFDPEDASAAIEHHGVTCAAAGPTEFRELVDADTATNLSSLDWLATRARVPRDVREAFPVPLLRVYGRPETGVNVLRETPDSGTVLAPFPGCAVRLRDEMEGEKTEADAETAVDDGNGTDETTDIGELFVRGPATASGYLDGERFGDWVPTGDVFRRESDDSNGYVLVADGDSFEHEGNRIHPRAVETVLESHPDVRAVGVVETAAETGGSAPKAVVVGDVEPGELREFAEERLAPYEVPRAIELVASLPRRSTGELDRAELRRRFATREYDDG